MAKGITGKEPDPRIVYADIIDLPHHQSSKHPHMSLYDRAAQFASYKALSGYEDMIGEEARQTNRKIDLEEPGLDVLNQKLNLINDMLADGENPAVSFTFFVADAKKAGGAYVTRTDRVKRIDALEQAVILCSANPNGINETIPIRDIVEIHGDSVDSVDSD